MRDECAQSVPFIPRHASEEGHVQCAYRISYRDGECGRSPCKKVLKGVRGRVEDN